MVTLTIEIDQARAKNLTDVLDNNPGWTKTLVLRALLVYFLQLSDNEQVSLIKKYGKRV